MDESTRQAKAPAKPRSSKPKPDAPAQPENNPATSAVAAIQKQVEEVIRPLFTEAMSYDKKAYENWVKEYRQAFDGLVQNESPTAGDIQSQEQFDFTHIWLKCLIEKAKTNS